ncbi:hypothetical protein ACFPRL_27080 [Pseudoclavibacter helvolus]
MRISRRPRWTRCSPTSTRSTSRSTLESSRRIRLRRWLTRTTACLPRWLSRSPTTAPWTLSS